MHASTRQILLNLLRQLQYVKSHIKGQIRFCETHYIWDLQPPELVSHVESLERQLREIEERIDDIQLEIEVNSIRGQL